jgi:hypothetical protein
LKNKEENLLDLIPEIICRWEKNQEGKIYLLVPRFRSPLLRKIGMKFGRSEWVRIILDEKGTKSWGLINGKRSVHEIGELLEKEMGDSVKPVYDRLSQFITILFKNKFIVFKNYHPKN